MKIIKLVMSICLVFVNILMFSQPDSKKCCGELYRRLGISEPIHDNDTCTFVNFEILSRLNEKRQSIQLTSRNSIKITPRDLQTKKTNTPNSVAAVNQGDAAPNLYPFALAGGSVGGTGSEAGTNALTTLSLNPAIFFANMEDPAESAKWGRVMDLSVIVPINEVQSGNVDKLSYFGLRGRINTLRSLKEGELYKKALSGFEETLFSDELELEKIEGLLLNAPDCRKCLLALVKFLEGDNKIADLNSACVSNIDFKEGDEIYADYKVKLDQLVEEADKKYFGVDLRGDFGDPSLGAVDSARGTSLYAGVGWGKSLKSNHRASTNIRLGLGIRYKDMEQIEANVFDLDGAVGFDITWPYQFQQVKFGLGFEFRTNLEEKVNQMITTDLTEAFETDYFYFRTSLNIPITPSNSFSLQYGTAIAGKKSSVLSLNFNWKLLLEDD